MFRAAAGPVYPRSALRPGPGVGDGLYCLDFDGWTDHCESFLYVRRSALPSTPTDVTEAMDFMETQVRKDSLFGHPVSRRQCTFAADPYKNYQLVSDRATWPKLVHEALDFVRAMAAELGIPNPEAYTGAHANLYPDGDSKVPRHADDEPQLVKEAPIFSLTFIESDDPSLARPFTIWRTPGASRIEGKGKVAAVTLYSGDVVVMMGKMQRDFRHSIEPVKDRPVARRLNITVRQFNRRKRKHASDS